MNIFLLWFSIFSFTVFTLSIFPVVLVYRQRGCRRSELHYIRLMLSYCLWLILFSFLFFSDVFVRPVSMPVRTIFGILRTAVTAAVLVLYPAIIISSSGDPGSKISAAVLIAPAIYVILIIPVFITQSAFIAGIITILFNVYMLSVLLSARFHYRGDRQSRSGSIRFFLKLSFAYCVFNLVFSLLPPRFLSSGLSIILSVVPRALFCLLWGLFEIAGYMRREYLKEKEGAQQVSSVFSSDYSITPREKEVISCLRRGLSHNQTAEELFISSKTVETHIYSIYRKCGVKNKVELINILGRY